MRGRGLRICAARMRTRQDCERFTATDNRTSQHCVQCGFPFMVDRYDRRDLDGTA